MKKILTLSVIIAIATVFSSNAFSCDETCLRDKAQTSANVKFPGYLTWKYCEGITIDFMTSAIRSLDSYHANNFSTKYKGPLKNMHNYLAQRTEWVKECDNYLTHTKKSRVFGDKKTTESIFSSIKAVDKEFTALIDGASYSTEEDAKKAMGAKIQVLAKQVDDHKTIMHMKGRYVLR